MSAVPISIEISGVRHGWASATVRAPDAKYVIDGFSYTTDAFADLARFGADVALDAPKAEVRFDGEPCGWRWEFESTWSNDGVRDHFRIHDVESYYDLASPSTEVFAAVVERDQVAVAVLEALREVESNLGIAGFEEEWGQPFPVRGVVALEAALITARRPAIDPGPAVAMTVIGERLKSFTFDIESPLQDDVRALATALNEFTYRLTPAEFRHHMTVEQMAGADTAVFIVRDETGSTVGMGALRRHSDGVAEVKRMFVAPSARGYGIGGQLLKHIEKLARDEGFARLVLETGSNFDAAKRIYERGGFQTCEPVLDYPPSAWTAFYAKSLSPND